MADLNVALGQPELYFMNRLGTLRRSQELTSSMQFDLASSPLNDDQLDEVSTAFGGNAHATGFGFSEAMRDMLSREPKRVATPDIATLQQNLVSQGYAPPDSLADGTWTPDWYAYFRRWDRDNYDKVLAGHHWGAFPIEAGFRLIADTLPSAVWQGLVGSAVGLKNQAFGTDQEEGSLERLGAVGGALGGAAIGGIVGGPVGAGVGAGVGAVVGFLGDVFGEDPSEQDQSFGGKLLDALSPFEEYADKGWRAFWTDLGFIGTAASLVSGGKMAITGASAVLGGISATAAEEGVPALTAALARPATAQPGLVTRMIAGATKGFSPGTAEWVTEQAIKYGPAAQMARPAFQVVNKAYTGLAAGSIGARLSAGFDLQTGAVGQTQIEKAIVETDPLKSGISLPFLGDAVDWASFVLVPERFLPWEAGSLGASARRMMGDVGMWPWMHAAQTADPTLSSSAARNWVTNEIAPELNTYGRLDYGIHTEALDVAKRTGVDYNKARAGVVDQIHAEAAEIGWKPIDTEGITTAIRRGEEPELGSLTAELMARSVRSPERFAGWLMELPGEGIGKFQAYKEVAAAARKDTRDVTSGRVLVTKTPQAFIAGASGLEVAGYKAEGFEIAQLKVEAENLSSEIKRQTRRLERATDPAITRRLKGDLEKLTARNKVVTDTLKAAAEAPPRVGELNVMAARQDFMTRRDLFKIRDEYNALRREVAANFEADLDNAVLEGRNKLSLMLHDMGARGLIPDKLMQKALEAGVKPGDEVAKHLEHAAQTAARDVELAPERMQFYTDRGYKPVVTGESVLQLNEIDEIANVMGVGNYTRRAAFFETLGLSPRFTRDEDYFALKVATERSELGRVFEKNDIPMNGNQALSRIHDYLSAQNREGVIWGPILKKARGRPHMPYVDARQLTPEDLYKVFEDVPNFTENTAGELMGALKRGSALGAEVQFAAPLVSARSLGRAMKVSGLQGFGDYIRTLKVPVTPRILTAAAGGIAGATAGGLFGDEPKDILTGAVAGTALGLGYAQAAKRTYGYLPDALARMNLALRYTFSATFDLGRYSEAGMIAAAKYNLPPAFAPRRKLMNDAAGFKSPYTDELVHGEEAWAHAIQLQDELNGTYYFGGLEDAERRVFQAGLLGFKPRDFEAYYGFEMYQRGWSKSRIKEAVADINRYGMGRTAAEKTANFVFFPFSFSKKLLNTMGDFILQAPGRNLLLHEGLRRYHQSSLDEDFHDFIENHAPILKQLAQVNNLVYGLSPGRFFLEGIADHRTAAGLVSQILASILVPGGSATPFAAATGQAGDLAMNAFVPVVITGESLDRGGGIDGLDDILRRYVPFIREIDQYFVQGEGGVVGGAVGEQVAAITSPTHETPYSQLTGYLDEIRAWKADLEPTAQALGYVSTDGLLTSQYGAPFAAQYDKLKNDLRIKYPQGWAMVSEIDNTSIINEAALNDLARQVQDGQASPSEENILLLQQEARDSKNLFAALGMPADIGSALIGSKIRAMAMKYQSDPRFMELYRRFYEREYGPLEITAA
jgi:hypothetical protein